MTESARNVRKPASEAEIAAYTIGGARPHGGPVFLAEYDESWPLFFANEAERITKVLGPVVGRIAHVGSTSVTGLAAKPVIDMVMEVTDSRDESAYVTPLGQYGHELRIRERAWYEHRVLKGLSPDINLHVFTVGCPEVARMLRFRDHLRANPDDRRLYEATKRELARREWAYIQNYADAKTGVIDEIIARAVSGDA